MNKNFTVENIKALDKGKFYIIKLDSEYVPKADAFALSKELTKHRIEHVITFFNVKFAEEELKPNKNQKLT